MAYKIIDIQGIGEAYAPKLIAIGIKTPEELLEACLTPSARKKAASAAYITGCGNVLSVVIIRLL